MNKKLYFNIDTNSDINTLNKDFEYYKKLKTKFIIDKDKYTKKEQETFLENFYNAKLNTIISIIYHHSDKGQLCSKNNPFSYLCDNKEIKKYSYKICDVLLSINEEELSKKEELIDAYENLTALIEKNKNISNTFIKNNEFWNEFTSFYKSFYAN